MGLEVVKKVRNWRGSRDVSRTRQHAYNLEVNGRYRVGSGLGVIEESSRNWFREIF